MSKTQQEVKDVLGLTGNETLEQLLSVLNNYITVTDTELNNMKNISVQTLPTIVRNQEQLIKGRIHNPVTSDSQGMSAILNKRVVLLKAIIDKMISTITEDITTHTSNKNNPHEVNVGQIGAVGYNASQELNATQKNTAKANLDLDKVENKEKDSQITEGTDNYVSSNAVKSYVDGAKTNLQKQINTLKSVQNVVDTVATKSELNSYVTTNLDDEDKIQVIADESVENGDSPTTIYRWSKANSQWIYIGAYGGSSYTKTQTDTELAKKLNKNTTDAMSLYGTSTAGTQVMYGVGQGATGDKIVQRTSAGHVNVPETPTANEHASSKKYVDTKTADIPNKQPKTLDTSLTISNTVCTTVETALAKLLDYISSLDEIVSTIQGSGDTSLANTLSSLRSDINSLQNAWTQFMEGTSVDNVINTLNEINLALDNLEKEASDTEITDVGLSHRIKLNPATKYASLDYIGGNSVKYAPSTSSDSSVSRVKSIPANTYNLNVAKIGGMSYKVNQLVQNGNFETTNNWGANNSTFTVSNNIGNFTASSQSGNINQYVTPFIDGHKYLALVQIKLTTATTDVQLFVNGGYLSVYTTATTGWQTLSKIFEGHAGSSSDNNFTIRDRRTSDWDLIQVRNIMLIDLTIESIDTTDIATAQAELLKRGINTSVYNAYDSGSIRDTATTSVVSSGFNKWDEEWEVGNYNTLPSTQDYGEKESSLTTIRCKNPISVLPNKLYYINSGDSNANGFILYYDINNVVISHNYFNNSGTFKTPNNCYYITFYLGKSYGTTYNNDVCINISNASLNGTYKPYIAPITKPIPAEIQALTGYGWGINETVYNAVVFTNKKFGQKVGRVDLGSLEWGFVSNMFYAIYSSIKTPANNNTIANILCSKYTNATYNQVAARLNDKTIGIRVEDNSIRIYDTAYTDPQAFKTAMSGVYLYYELATPVETDVSAYLTDFNPIATNDNYTDVEFVNQYNADVPSTLEFYGTIKDTLVTAVKFEGYNVWDEQWELGLIQYDKTQSNFGENISSSINVRSKNYISVNPNTTYYFSNGGNGNIVCFFYDSNKTPLIIGSSGYQTVTNSTYTMPSNCYYVRFYLNTAYGATYNNDICINESDTNINGTYYPYQEPRNIAIPYETSDGYGISDTCFNKRDFEDRQRSGRVDKTALNLNYTYSNDVFISSDINNLVKKPATNGTVANVICSIYDTKSQYDVVNTYDNSIGINTGGSIYISNSSYDNATTFKSAMANVDLYYETAEETKSDYAFDNYDDLRIIDTSKYGFITLVNANNQPARYSVTYSTSLRSLIMLNYENDKKQQEDIDELKTNKQPTIDSTHKLSADLVDDTSATNKFVTASEKTDIANNTSARHTHSNKELLDTYTQTENNLADAVDKKHSHSNKSVLDGISATDVSNWNGKMDSFHLYAHHVKFVGTANSQTCEVYTTILSTSNTKITTYNDLFYRLVTYIGYENDGIKASGKGNGAVYSISIDDDNDYNFLYVKCQNGNITLQLQSQFSSITDTVKTIF